MDRDHHDHRGYDHLDLRRQTPWRLVMIEDGWAPMGVMLLVAAYAVGVWALGASVLDGIVGFILLVALALAGSYAWEWMRLRK